MERYRECDSNVVLHNFIVCHIVTAQICKVHRPLMSVKKICRNGQRVVFDDEGSYVENKWTGERIKVLEEDGEYVLDVWVKIGEEQEATFGGQGKCP